MRHYEHIDYSGNAHLSLDKIGVEEQDIKNIIEQEENEVARSDDSSTVVVLGEVGQDQEVRVVYRESPDAHDATILGVSSE